MSRNKEWQKILIIDNNGNMSEGGYWVELAKKYGVGYEAIIKDTKEEILAELSKMFARSARFAGTILDIIYKGQSEGGMELWEVLKRKGVRARCGHLLVTTKMNSEEVLQFVKSEHALLNTRMAKPHKEVAFREFLKICGLP